MMVPSQWDLKTPLFPDLVFPHHIPKYSPKPPFCQVAPSWPGAGPQMAISGHECFAWPAQWAAHETLSKYLKRISAKESKQGTRGKVMVVFVSISLGNWLESSSIASYISAWPYRYWGLRLWAKKRANTSSGVRYWASKLALWPWEIRLGAQLL